MTRATRRLPQLLLLGLAAACGSTSAGYNLAQATATHLLADRLLPTDSGLGGEVYGDVLRYSWTVREYTEKAGRADYVMVEQENSGSLMRFTLLYAKEDKAVYFRNPNPFVPTFSTVIEERPMPRKLFGRMSVDSQRLARAGPRERPLNGRWLSSRNKAKPTGPTSSAPGARLRTRGRP